MSRTEDFCECSKPNSQKRCRIACGNPSYPKRNKLIVMDWHGELPEDVYERVLKIMQQKDEDDG